MCTVTIHRTEDEIALTMNRDELLSRGREQAPAYHPFDTQGAAWLAPIDSDSGGTWMGVNDHGVIICLLNIYFPNPDRNILIGEKSRGLIIPKALRHGSYANVCDWIRHEFDPTVYANFLLVVAALDETRHFLWHGQDTLETVVNRDRWRMLSSSLVDTEAVLRWRETQFAHWAAQGYAGADTLPSFHLLQVKGSESFSPLMTRECSATRSITQVRVHGTVAVMRYWPNPSPDTCAGSPDTQTALELIGAADELTRAR